MQQPDEFFRRLLPGRVADIEYLEAGMFQAILKIVHGLGAAPQPMQKHDSFTLICRDGLLWCMSGTAGQQQTGKQQQD